MKVPYSHTIAWIAGNQLYRVIDTGHRNQGDRTK
jgi:hypothetical protein